MAENNQPISTSMLAHKGEVVLNFSQSIRNLFLPPQAAREFAQNLINCAEAAEQQMDAERG